MRAIALLAAAVVGLTLTACAPQAEEPQQPTGLTSEQSERLAVTRFRNFDAGVRAVTLSVPTTEVGAIELTGWFDFATGVGYGSVTDGGTVWWNSTTVAFRDVAGAATLPLPADQWVSYPLAADANPLAAALVLVTSLGFDRPDNPQLLAQSDAAMLRSDVIGDVEVDVFAGPSSGTDAPSELSTRARYWIDDTGLLLRFEAPGSGTATTVDFSPADAITLPTVNPGAP